MEQFTLELLGNTGGLAAYGLVFGVLVACGLGLPLPEDVSLITGGYLAYRGQASFPVMLGVGFAGILLGDSIVFYLGRRSRGAVDKLPRLLRRVLTPERLEKVEGQFARRGPIMVVVARFLPGIRAATFFVAGSAQMSYFRFIIYDGVAALVSAPLFVWIGYRFGDRIGEVIAWAEEFHTWLIGGMVVLAIGWLVYTLVKRRRAAGSSS